MADKLSCRKDHPGVFDILLLLNAMYFKGLWAKPFGEELTRPGDFNLLGLR